MKIQIMINCNVIQKKFKLKIKNVTHLFFMCLYLIYAFSTIFFCEFMRIIF